MGKVGMLENWAPHHSQNGVINHDEVHGDGEE